MAKPPSVSDVVEDIFQSILATPKQATQGCAARPSGISLALSAEQKTALNKSKRHYDKETSC